MSGARNIGINDSESHSSEDEYSGEFNLQRLEDKGLNHFDLDQYDELTIYAIEQNLYAEFHHLMANRIKQYDGRRASIRTNSYWFYLMPSASYMLFDVTGKNDENYYRHENFKRDIRACVKEQIAIDASSNNKAIIFCGMINLEARLYFPYFIHGKQNNQVQVLIVDASPLIYPLRAKLDSIFSDIFDDEELVYGGLSSSNKVQMLHERDCGPCSAMTLRDAFVSCTTNRPLVILQDDQLMLDDSVLSIAELSPDLINDYTAGLFYSSVLCEKAKKNREFWRERLGGNPISVEDEISLPLSIFDVYDLDEQIPIEYNYDYVKEMQIAIRAKLRASLESSYMRYAKNIFISNKDYLTFANAGEIFSSSNESGTAIKLIHYYLHADDRESNCSSDFCLNYMLSNGAYTPLGEDFLCWFQALVSHASLSYYVSCTILKNNIEHSLEFINQIKKKLASQAKIQEFIFVEKKLRSLERKMAELDLTPSSILQICHQSNQTFEQSFQEIQDKFFASIRIFCSEIYKNYYYYAEVKPGSNTALLRSLFCNLLHIQTEFILTEEMAREIDDDIKQKMTLSSPPPLYVITAKPSLLVLEEVKELPATYQVDLTTSLLLQCISYWYSQSTFSYKLLNPTLWLVKTPSLILAMIQLINHLGYADDAQLQSRQLNALRKIIDAAIEDEDKIFSSDDIFQKIVASLLRTRQFCQADKSQLSFAEITEFIRLAEEAAKRTRTISVTETERTNLHLEVQSVEKTTQGDKIKLERTSIHKFFNAYLTRIEKLLLQIQAKHDHQKDFYLDEVDITKLCNMLKTRWHELVDDLGEEQAVAHYCQHEPSREISVYIVMAEILALHFRKQGRIVQHYELLMSDNQHFLPSNSLAAFQLSEEHANTWMLEGASNSISYIPLKYLLTLQSGHAVHLQWICQQYFSTRMLIHPYTGKFFTQDEIFEICAHPHARKLIDQVRINCSVNLHTTPRAIAFLREYLNKAIFDIGFSWNYDDSQNAQAFSAYLNFTEQIMTLDPFEREALLNESIPDEEDLSVLSCFGDAEISGHRAHRKGPVCLTIRGTCLAKVVIAYEGEGAKIFLMTAAENEYYQSSDFHQLYLYKEDEAEGMFYYVEEDDDRRYLEELPCLPDEDFNSLESDNEAFNQAVLAIAAERGHCKLGHGLRCIKLVTMAKESFIIPRAYPALDEAKETSTEQEKHVLTWAEYRPSVKKAATMRMENK